MKYTFGHNDEKTAYTVKDYPWGFRLRTEQRHWIESKKGRGQRHVTQTLNPKNGQWCKPKKSTYTDIIILGIDEKTGHLTSDGYSVLYTGQKELDEFLSRVGYENLDEFQKKQIKFAQAIIKTREHITVEIKPQSTQPISLSKLASGDPEERKKADEIERHQDENKKKQEEVKKDINRLFNYYLNR